MRKLSLILGLSVLLLACDDDPDQGSECPKCETQSCPKQECPSLECNGTKCPSCPSCPTCNTTSEQCNTTELDAKITRLTGDLESCNGDLDSCTTQLSNKARNIKSGSRIKVSQYVGEDGSQLGVYLYFDTLKNKQCTLTNFSSYSKYGCDTGIYCTTSSEYKKSSTFVDPSLHNVVNGGDLSAYCSETYDYDSIIMSVFGKMPKVISISHRDGFYLDSSCSTPVPATAPYIIDSSCDYNKDSIFHGQVVETGEQQEAEHVCMDGSIYKFNYGGTTVRDVFYRPKYTTFTKLYGKNGSNCSELTSYKNVILLEEVTDLSYEKYLQQARENRNKACKQICEAINQEAIDESWVKIQLVEVQ